MDNTYKTNRYGLYLTQITAVTDQNTTTNIAFALLSSETKESYYWMLGSLNQIREEQNNIRAPLVIITDMELALKNAVKAIFPDCQQQLCHFHLFAAVQARIKRDWQGDEPRITNNKEHNAFKNNPTGLFKAFKRLVAADQFSDFRDI
uniref:MULE transposase domain-containing protein n=1 Tax=Photinus pyralis TaxID=7054 RepID=A0A1Y1LWZ3_PHOPY